MGSWQTIQNFVFQSISLSLGNFLHLEKECFDSPALNSFFMDEKHSLIDI